MRQTLCFCYLLFQMLLMVAADTGPVTVSRPYTDLPEPSSTYPPSWNGDSICDSPFGALSKANNQPELKIFEFKSIKWIEDNFYEVMIEFEIDGNSYTESELRAIYIFSLQTPDYYLGSVELFVESWEQNLLGDSPFHFYFTWVMEAEDIDQLTCTTPFQVYYDWDTYFATYQHGCFSDELTDLPAQCWDKPNFAETSSQQNLETSSQQNLEASTESFETTQSQGTSNVVATPSTIEPTRTDLPVLPSPIDCPSSWTSNSVCAYDVGEHARNANYPEVQIFEFKSIQYLTGNLYQVLFEFKVDGSVYPKDHLKHIYVGNLHMPGGYSFGDYLYNPQQDDGIDLVGDSPFHFYYSWVMEMQQINEFTCTTPFEISYLWQEVGATYAHGCDVFDGVGDLPLLCWEEVCEPLAQTTTEEEDVSTSAKPESSTVYQEPTPSTINPPRTNLPSMPDPTACPTSWNGNSVCDIPIGAHALSESTYPKVKTFNFESIKFIQDDLYEVTLEFEIEDTIPKSELHAVFAYYLQTPDDYLSSIQLDAYVGNSPYHFYLVWIMKTQNIDQYICTTPFTIEYNWNGIPFSYTHGCLPDDFGDLHDSPLQCWKNVCDIHEQTTTEQESNAYTESPTSQTQEETTISTTNETTIATTSNPQDETTIATTSNPQDETTIVASSNTQDETTLATTSNTQYETSSETTDETTSKMTSVSSTEKQEVTSTKVRYCRAPRRKH
ncbi:uncharacterized protein SPAPADRAFT_68962 [Spathaspora passalidarum NRRL Y-27907]|uniref:Flo11 domain-containing protein n=1 Tax=Spathaspora passalidarum (strain NRRL Y-27907 / 11-Y1) TaxID=619300 RepID=G3AVC2_SPAPN|nr:uncharacterized protein SPAPADRAFT_68962 [Spathaspora passalidarum NRRL Y-27907]EGW30141.1 hypothetical protein SPAPADRAFT_68962 [Spathaspora passalidarum NRRL Y-27907]